MTTFSSIGNMLNRVATDTSDETCDKHDVPLVKFSGTSMVPFCPACAVERTKQKEQDLINYETKKAEQQNKKTFLERYSLLSSQSTKDATFENFKTEDEETAMNKEKALNVARSYYKGEKMNVMFMGKFGAGKTHLAMAILKKLNEFDDEKDCLFISIDELYRRIKGSFDDDTSPYKEQHMIKMLNKVDYLVIDDLGSEVGAIRKDTKATPFSYRILNAIARGRETKSTIYTTNLTKEQLYQVYDGRIVSPMMQDSITIKFESTSDKRTDRNFRR